MATKSLPTIINHALTSEKCRPNLHFGVKSLTVDAAQVISQRHIHKLHTVHQYDDYSVTYIFWMTVHLS